jgi:hypothetical protein
MTVFIDVELIIIICVNPLCEVKNVIYKFLATDNETNVITLSDLSHVIFPLPDFIFD